MNDFNLSRRDFLAATAAAGAAIALSSTKAEASGEQGGKGPLVIEAFDYQGIKLRPSHWQRQYQLCRDFYFGVSDDDILHGYRRAANLPAPGKVLGGWCNTNSNTVFGQWLQGMSRMYKATGDNAMRDKAIKLVTEWAKTLPANGNSGMGHYPFEKLVGGLTDMKHYANFDDALPLLDKVITYAAGTLNRARTPANPRPWELHSGTPGEWYTLAENLYRAYQITKNEKYREFAEVWHYTPWWDKFEASADAKDVWGVHAYSHVNSFSSCAMAYAVTGDKKYLTILKNAYDFMQNSQTFATGGYGPVERLMPPNGNLGASLELRQNSCEAPCCSWAAIKMCKYLIQFTGEARYGDWLERLVYNAIGAALPITENGKNFYYADYRVAGGYKTYARSTYTCCSGTYIQAVTDYHNIIYFKDANSLYVNLYLPSELTWTRAGSEVRIVQDTQYPEGEVSTFTISTQADATRAPARFALKFRIPGWAKDVSISVGGQKQNIEAKPGTWAVIDREWTNNDKVEIRIPLPFRYMPVDKQHPDRVAVVRGPVVMVQDASVHEPVFALPPTDEELNKVLFAAGAGQRDPGLPPPPASNFALRLTGKNAADPTAANSPGGRGGRGAADPQAGARFQPFYQIQEVNAYHMYFDRTDAPKILW